MPTDKSSTHTQLALLLDAPRGNWVIAEREIPKPAPGEVLVKLLVTALNPSEWRIRTFALPFVTEYPAVLGIDGAGEVVELGEGVKTLSKGDVVFFEGLLTNDKATLQQYVLVPAEVTAKVPANLTVEQAASISVALVTAAVALYADRRDGSSAEKLTAPWEEGGIGKYVGRPIVIFGGSSNVGYYAIQLAKLSGFSTIITTASTRHNEVLAALGATRVIDRADSDIPNAIRNILAESSNPNPLAIVLDTISSAETQRDAISVLAPGGILVLVLTPLVEPGQDKHIEVAFGNSQVPQNRKLGVQLFAKLQDWFGRGVLKPIDTVEVLPGGLNAVEAGLERIGSGQVSRAKLVVRPTETVRA